MTIHSFYTKLAALFEKKLAAPPDKKLAVAVVILSLLIPISTSARPSLIDLESDLQQVVDGLCHGDPALCGLGAPAVVGGQLDFDSGTFQVDFTSLTFGYTKPGAGAFAFDDLTATVDAAGLAAILVGELASSTIYDVDVIVPDPSGPGSVILLALQNVRIDDLALSSSGTSAAITLGFTIAQFDWMGSNSSWNQVTSTGSGCTAPGGDKMVALAGNSPSLLAPSEIEVTYFLFIGPGGLGFRFGRSPVASSACYLQTVASGTTVADSFSRLSPLSDTFATQLRDESIDFTTALLESYTLTIEGTEMDELVTYGATMGTLTTRTFSPVDGSVTSETSQPI